MKGELKKLVQILTVVLDNALKSTLPMSVVRIGVAYDEQLEKLIIHHNSLETNTLKKSEEVEDNESSNALSSRLIILENLIKSIGGGINIARYDDSR